MMELLQEKNKGKIVLCNCGNFYIATGKDAITLYESLNLQLSCFKQEICKVGFPIASLEKYTDMIQEKGYGYIVYYFDKQKEELEKIKEYQGKEIILFNLKQEEYIMWLYEQLKNKTYKHGGYTEFYVTEPKVRKIEKSRYLDRIVHRWVVDNFLEPCYVPKFINTSYACLKNRGMHKAAIYVKNTMKHCKAKWNEYYILKMDVSKYFDNINKKILLKILEKNIKDQELMWLIKEILYANKREKGLEIGNYTSQMFANIYLNEIDQYIKHKLKVRYYCRYLDDSIVIVKTKKEAKETLEKIRKYLKENLELELNQKTQIFKNKQGVNFCGYKINEYRMKLRDKGKRKLKKKVKKLKEEIQKGNLTSKQAKKYLAGHLGYIKYANNYNLLNKIFYIE